jgi:SAM-dependent methyltransferase
VACSALETAKTCVKKFLSADARGILARMKVCATPLTDIPQANMEEENLRALEARDWRGYFAAKLSGKGLEIGPLHRPMVRHPGMDIDYIDRCTVEELRKHYPELKDQPLVEPTIIGDAETLGNIEDSRYDFVVAAHVIEHMKNPLLALAQWVRVLKPGGLIYMLVPDKRATFDKKRVRTTLAHMVLDYQRPAKERDYEHYLDYAIHVHNKDAHEAVEEADRLIATDYSIHYHVFLPTDALNLIYWFSGHIAPLAVAEGPVMSPGSDEFHFLLKKL